MFALIALAAAMSTSRPMTWAGVAHVLKVDPNLLRIRNWQINTELLETGTRFQSSFDMLVGDDGEPLSFCKTCDF